MVLFLIVQIFFSGQLEIIMWVIYFENIYNLLPFIHALFISFRVQILSFNELISLSRCFIDFLIYIRLMLRCPIFFLSLKTWIQRNYIMWYKTHAIDIIDYYSILFVFININRRVLWTFLYIKHVIRKRLKLYQTFYHANYFWTHSFIYASIESGSILIVSRSQYNIIVFAQNKCWTFKNKRFLLFVIFL